MITKKGDFRFNKNLKEFNKLKVSIPIAIGNMAKNHFLQAFRRGAQNGGGFTNSSRNGWPKRKRETRISRNKGILISSGHLRRSIGVLSKSWRAIVLGTKGILYAEVHNKGGSIRTRNGKQFKMPKREYLGDSSVLNKKIVSFIYKKLRITVR